MVFIFTLLDGPSSLKYLEVALHHLEFNIPPPAKVADLNIPLVAIKDPLRLKCQPQGQVLLAYLIELGELVLPVENPADCHARDEAGEALVIREDTPHRFELSVHTNGGADPSAVLLAFHLLDLDLEGVVAVRDELIIVIAGGDKLIKRGGRNGGGSGDERVAAGVWGDGSGGGGREATVLRK